jgi:Na+/H+ antiporter NhaD/arsenite permease-like protein
LLWEDQRVFNIIGGGLLYIEPQMILPDNISAIMSYKIIVLSVFILSYIGIIVFTRQKSYFAGIGAFLIILFTGLFNTNSASEISGFIVRSINWNVLGIFIGTLLIAEAFIDSRVPALLAHFLISKSKNIGMAILLICMMASILSAFVENVATVLIVAPIALAIAKKQKISPVPFLIGIAISSNLQGTATLIGDPPSMILAGYMGLNFNQFFFLQGKLGIFFAVQVGAVVSFFVLHCFFRKYKNPTFKGKPEEISSWFPTVLILLMIVLLAISSFVDPNFSYLGGIICMVLGAVAILWFIFRRKLNREQLLKKIDFDTLIFLASIFILVGGLLQAGAMNDIAALVLRYIGEDTFLIYNFIVWFSIFISAFVDNVPYITAMIPVVKLISAQLAVQPYLLVFGLLVGSCLGGNITPVGAAANVVSVSILKKQGYIVGIKEFGKIGLPFTIVATAASSIFVWFIWR